MIIRVYDTESPVSEMEWVSIKEVLEEFFLQAYEGKACDHGLHLLIYREEDLSAIGERHIESFRGLTGKDLKEEILQYPYSNVTNNYKVSTGRHEWTLSKLLGMETPLCEFERDFGEKLKIEKADEAPLIYPGKLSETQKIMDDAQFEANQAFIKYLQS
ncbi:MAG: hypothetical protein ACE5FT_04495 [Candidatus Nanoarchaeia archaeon]